jgi:hypothetical protein
MSGMMKLYKVVVIVVLTIMLFVSVVGATGEVTWYWKSETFANPPATHASDKTMDQYSPTGTTDNIVTLDPDEEAWWYVENAAQCDLSFPLGNWIITCWIETNSPDNERVTIYVYNITNAGEEKQIDGSRYKGLSSAEGVYKLSKTFTTDSAINIYEGDRIAVRVTFSSAAEAGEWLKIHYNSISYDSSLTSPPNSPVCPVPELSTLILLSIGLITLTGYVLLTRRQK